MEIYIRVAIIRGDLPYCPRSRKTRTRLVPPSRRHVVNAPGDSIFQSLSWDLTTSLPSLHSAHFCCRITDIHSPSHNKHLSNFFMHENWTMSVEAKVVHYDIIEGALSKL
ncbi:hypothetical protein ECG_06845 [Echinococcus granulosus]|nr:hypothetical protein ECG_06845 [Echinococcus granulosus]